MSGLTKNRKFGLVRKSLIQRYGKEKTAELIALAETHYANCEAMCQDATAGEWTHLNSTILLTVSIYKALREIDAEHAFENAHNIMMELCGKAGAAAGKLMKLPGMKNVFLWLMPKMAVNLFGPGCGFAFENFEADKTMLKMDMTACPYCRYADKLGCPELMPVFCDSDLATYGNLPGIQFKRTQTLGTGGTKCDFQFVRE